MQNLPVPAGSFSNTGSPALLSPERITGAGWGGAGALLESAGSLGTPLPMGRVKILANAVSASVFSFFCHLLDDFTLFSPILPLTGARHVVPAGLEHASVVLSQPESVANFFFSPKSATAHCIIHS